MKPVIKRFVRQWNQKDDNLDLNISFVTNADGNRDIEQYHRLTEKARRAWITVMSTLMKDVLIEPN